MGNAVGLKQNLDKGVLAWSGLGNRMRDPMLADLDLTKLQSGNGRIVDPSLERRSVERIHVELAAQFRQRVGPAFDLPFGRQAGSAEGMHGIWHDATT